jgi:predicted MPP superfamily phosphohydrolase
MNQQSISIQVYSDLHLELTKRIPQIKPMAPYLFLAGDISKVTHSSFREFLSYCNIHWEKTFYVMGNHEYWNPNSSMQDIKKKMAILIEEEKLTNIKILDNSFEQINDDVYVFGSTFWTKSPFLSHSEGKMYINDYNMIKIKKNTSIRPYDLTPFDVNKLHYMDDLAIYNFLNYSKLATEKKIIMVTHFPVQRTNTSHPKYNDINDLSKKYYTHPDNTLKNLDTISNIICWISGHTHYSYDFICDDGVRLISNQLGYLGEAIHGDSGCKEDGLFEIIY